MEKFEMPAGKVSRRGFVAGSVLAGLAVSASTACLQAHATEGTPDGAPADALGGYKYEAENAEGEWIHCACQRNCFDTCMMLGKVVDGRLVEVRGDEENPYTAGGLCVKTQNYVDWQYSPDRILYPLKRTGAKGPGCTFERISWEEAIETITSKWKEIIENYGGEAITWSRYQGNQGAVNRRVFEPVFYKMGATYCDGTMCNNAYVNALPYTTGGVPVMRAEEIANKDLYITWAHNASTGSLHTMKFVKEMNKKGGKIVVVNPVRTPECMWADLFVQLRPGTDVAFALGVGKYLIDNGLIDQDFIDAYSIGLDEYAAACAEWDAETVAQTCGIPAEQVAQFAEILWEGRENACLKTGLQLGRRINGGMSHIAVKCLSGLIGHPECYFNMTSSGGFNTNAAAMGSMLEATLPSESVKVGSIRNWSSPDLGKVLTCQNYGEDHNFADNPIRSLFVFGNNPLVSNPNINLVIDGLLREDLFTVVHEMFMTPTCEYADIILPAPSGFEYEEFNGGYGHNYDVISNKLVEPLGECISNWELTNMLGQAMGYDDEAFHRTIETFEAQFMEGRPYTLEELKTKGWIDVDPKSWDAIYAEGFPTASGKFQFACDELEANHGTRTVRYEADPESLVGDEELLGSYPLALVSPSAKEFLNGCFGNMPDNVALFGEPLLYMNENDAVAYGIADGDQVRVFNDRGELHRVARVVEGITAPGTVMTYKSTWSTVSGMENVNCVTTDARADIGRGVAFQSCLVQVEKA